MQMQSLNGAWQFSQAGKAEWLPAQVPGGVHTDLLALGRIPDPFVGDNEKRVQWVAESDWEYRHSFMLAPGLMAEEKVFLVCDGLDTLAEVFLNGKSLGKTANMFRTWRWDVRSLLREGANEIRIAFASPVQYCRQREAVKPLNTVSQAIVGGPHLRKAPCQFGWDWGPMLPPVGIWKEIRLEGYTTARLEDVHLRQQHTDGRVMVQAGLKISSWQKKAMTACLIITAPDGEKFTTKMELFEAPDVTLQVEVSRPQLWWPVDLGEHPLYQVEIALEDSDAKLLDEHKAQIGLRTIKLRQEPDQWGKSWQFVVNGVPIFAKGSNWIPADSFPTRLTEERLEYLIHSAVAVHQNMLRIWGGGIYEDERFYDLCDRYGVLVWQEFAFACSIYPLDEPDFVENIHHEAVENIHRLRHRACLALWCGNNEMEQGWVDWGWNKPEVQDLKAAYDRFFHHTLPAWVAAEDPDHSYWPSSASSGVPFEKPNGQEMGDSHYWDVWHGRKPFTAYRTNLPRFQSEFGFQSLPPLATIKTYAEPADWNMTSYIMEHHQRSWNGNGLMIGQMTDTFRMPKDFESLVYLSLVLQAEGIRYGVEHWRRHMERTSGTLIWQLNDCWPVASWASLDYFGRWKALHYLARRFYAPVHLSILDEGKWMGIHVANDQTTPFYGSARWQLMNLDGEVLSAGEETVLAAPLANTQVDLMDFCNVVSDENCREVVFVVDLLYGEKILSTSLATFAPNKHLSLKNPLLSTRVTEKDGRVAVAVKAKSLARFVELSLDGADVIFSDNYFDIPAGRTVTVYCPLPAGWDRAAFQKALRVKSLFDSY